MFEQVLTARKRDGSVATDVAEVQFKLAEALDHAHRHPARARDLARAAVATFSARSGFEAQRREAQAWLDKRGQTIGI
jgi:hypothetical protein